MPLAAPDLAECDGPAREHWLGIRATLALRCVNGISPHASEHLRAARPTLLPTTGFWSDGGLESANATQSVDVRGIPISLTRQGRCPGPGAVLLATGI